MRRVILELATSRITLEIVKGAEQVAFLERVPDEPSGEIDLGRWLAVAEMTLRQMVADTDATGLPTVCVAHPSVLSLDPGAATTVQSCPTSAGGRTAINAALLALDAATKLDRDDTPNNAVLAHTDSCPSATRRSHAVAYAVPDTLVEGVADLTRSVGLRFEGLIPGETVAVASTLASACLNHNDGPSAEPSTPRASVWIDSSCSCLCVVQAGRVLLVRPIPIGLDAIIDSLSKPIREPSSNLSCVRFDKAGARRLLETVGVPTPETTIEGHPGLSGANLLPLMQPALQRLAVEIKQSVRFGLSEEERQGLTLGLIGPAARTPRLATVLASLSGLEADGPPPIADRSVASRVPQVLLGRLLLPTSQTERQFNRAIKSAACVAAAIALAWIGWSAWTDRAAAALADREFAAHNAEAQSAQQRRDLAIKAGQIRAQLTAFKSRTEEAIGERMEWPTVLAWLSTACGDSVRLASIECESSESGPRIRLEGVAGAQGKTPPSETLASLLATLREWPLAEAVALRSATKVTEPGMNLVSFELSIELIGITPNAQTDADTPVLPTADIAGVEAQP